MNCRIYNSPDGKVNAIECGTMRLATPCQWSEGKLQSHRRCARAHTKLCDFKLEGPQAGKTCDRRMCDEHATEVAPNVHYCEIHEKFADEDRADPPTRMRERQPESGRKEVLGIFK